MPVRISFELDRAQGKLNPTLLNLSIHGETSDLSDTGIGFIVSSIRLREYYLVGEGRLLNAEVNLPKGKVKMLVIGTRYEQVGNDVAEIQYVIGAKIVEMSAADRNIYEDFLSQKPGHGGTLELGIDQR